jgi:Tfp pilus assembly protein PilX
MKADRTGSGFVLPVVLGIILIAALIAVEAATELGSATQLSTQRQLHQRAFESAESGVVTALDQLTAGSEPPRTQILRAHDAPTDSAIVESTFNSIDAPSGFSVDRVTERQYEIRSTGFSARGSEVTVVQGVRQFRVAAP